MIGSPEKSMTKQKLEEQVSNAIFYFFIQHDIKKFTLTEGYPCLTLPGVHGFTWPSIECHNKANTVRHDRTQQEGDHGLICVAPLRQVLNVFFVSNGGEIYFIHLVSIFKLREKYW